ncbi:MAG: hypothetical protein A3F83_12715 [Candidatus Glassbacteria bacterium RIFCSPLOWO2_12_FULL_58_11]|uniref:Uncharacterized protein n=1 Tax=Candidatus Glassbacteria bacterium RIFCSPLOWO2_12_FULL_58_11 TaxID=1817867 RepID=A0A1F5YLF5_9BACT|nr:MAG: hypothetical protein A3F83_12715 [Candidatus Glassbacteria bacterium RIFCSPLOWO2_12_FULL_58_11]
MTQVSAPFGAVVNEAGLPQPPQPLTVTLTLVDNSGTGLDFGNSLLKLFSPDSSEVAGTVTSESPTTLKFTASRLLSNDGSEDGRFILLAHIVDKMPVTGDLDTSFTFVYDNRRPAITEVKYAADTSSVTVRFEDLPARTGRASAGIVLQSAAAAAADPSGAALAVRTSHDGVSRLTLIFEGGKPTASGIYSLTFNITDQAGNTLDSVISFPLNIVGLVELFPPDSSVVTGPLARLYARVKGTAERMIPGADRSLTVLHFGVSLQGTTALSGDTLFLNLADTLATDGSADGLYEVRADLAIPELGSRSIARGIFTFDNVPPDTEAVEVLFEADNVRALVQFTDHGAYPAVSEIDNDSTIVEIEDPRGNQLQPTSRVWSDNTHLEARFAKLQNAGLHRLRLDIRDRAGLRTVYRVPLVNAAGGAAGRSVAFVDEVPARTSARINFFSGQSGKRIQRAMLRIFNLRGDLIRKLDVTNRIEGGGNSVTAEWLLENDGGSLVTNGVFIYYWEVTFDDGSTERIRKTLAVARR